MRKNKITMETDLIDNVYKMITKWNKDNYEMTKPEIVLISNPAYYYKLREEYKEKIRYLKSDYQYNIEFLNIIGIKVPVVISNEMPEDVEYTLMFRNDYERLEKERLYSKFMTMFN